jgi:creatinine amidohydrolase
MTLQEIREDMKEMKTVVLPVACTEQHGYHLPLSVDIHNATEIARMASEICGCFVAPTLPYSFSGGTLTGTVNISPQVYSAFLMDIFQSFVEQGFKNIVVFLGHGGTENNQATYDAATMFQRLRPSVVQDVSISVAGLDLSPTVMEAFDNGDYHAARYETSLMMFWKPEMVKMDRICRDEESFAELMRTDPDAYLNKTKKIDSPWVYPQLKQRPEMQVGVMGPIDGISAEYGKKIADELATGLADLVEKLERS